MTNYHIIKVRQLGITKTQLSRIKLTSGLYSDDSVTMLNEQCFNSPLEQAVDFLSQCEFAIVGTAEGRGCYYILTSTFKRLTKG